MTKHNSKANNFSSGNIPLDVLSSSHNEPELFFDNIQESCDEEDLEDLQDRYHEMLSGFQRKFIEMIIRLTNNRMMFTWFSAVGDREHGTERNKFIDKKFTECLRAIGIE